MKVYLLILSAIISLGVYSCNSGPVDSPGVSTPYFAKILTVESGSMKSEMYINHWTSLSYGYNELCFKVFINGVEKKDGFFKFRPMLYHSAGGPGQSSPVSDNFYYSRFDLFMGYACFTSVSDSTSKWYADLNYNDEYTIDSVSFQVSAASNKQMVNWYDTNGGHSYSLSYINDFYYETVGYSNVWFMLHRTDDYINYREVDSAYMGLKAYFQQTGEVYPNVLRALSMGNGKYKGSTDYLGKLGDWHVLDTVKVNDIIITKDPPPEFIINYH